MMAGARSHELRVGAAESITGQRRLSSASAIYHLSCGTVNFQTLYSSKAGPTIFIDSGLAQTMAAPSILIFQPDSSAPELSAEEFKLDKFLGGWHVVWSTLPLWKVSRLVDQPLHIVVDHLVLCRIRKVYQIRRNSISDARQPFAWSLLLVYRCAHNV